MRSFADFRRYRFRFNMAQIPLACVALYVGVTFGGLAGACIATVCLNLFEVTLGVAAVWRKLGVKLTDLKQLAPVAGVTPAAIVAMIASSAVRALIAPTHPIVILGACAIVFAFIYMVGAFLFGAYTEEDQDAIYKQAQRLIRKLKTVELPKPAAESELQSSDRWFKPVRLSGKEAAQFNSARDFTPECKARAVLQVLRDAGSASRICGELQIHERLLSDWKEQFIKQSSSIFRKEPDLASANERIAELERLVGRLRRELESERVAELERLVGRLMLELEESKGANGSYKSYESYKSYKSYP
jgi:transposase-like protein